MERVELQKEAHPIAEPLLRGHLIRPKLPQSRLNLARAKPVVG
jgi:hypothetical protein